MGRPMTTILYGRPPAVFDVPTGAVQTSPLIPGATALEDLAPGSVDEAMIYAPPGVVERRYTLAMALRALVDPHFSSHGTVYPRKLAFPSTGLKEPGSAKRRSTSEREVRTRTITYPRWTEGDFALVSHPCYDA